MLVCNNVLVHFKPSLLYCVYNIAQNLGKCNRKKINFFALLFGIVCYSKYIIKQRGLYNMQQLKTITKKTTTKVESVHMDTLYKVIEKLLQQFTSSGSRLHKCKLLPK